MAHPGTLLYPPRKQSKQTQVPKVGTAHVGYVANFTRWETTCNEEFNVTSRPLNVHIALV